MQTKVSLPSTRAFCPAARRLGYTRIVPPRAVQTVTDEVKSPFMTGLQFMNPTWGGVENEQQFFTVLKVV